MKAFFSGVPGGGFRVGGFRGGGLLALLFLFVTPAHAQAIAGISGTMSDDDILDAIERVDGAGSQLDADFLDGTSSQGFCQVTGGVDCPMVGCITIDNAGNPNSTYCEDGIDRSSAGAITYNIQNSGAGAMTLQVDGNTVWNAGNDGAGSTLDADFLDAISSAGFCQISGGVNCSMTGCITIDNAGNANSTYCEDGIDRSSAGAITYNIQNSGAGAMTLQVDGSTVLTAPAADLAYLRLDATNDPLTGPLAIANGDGAACAAPGLAFAGDIDTGLTLINVGTAPGHAIGLCVDGEQAGLLSIGASPATPSYGNTVLGWGSGLALDLTGGGVGDDAIHNTFLGAESGVSTTTGMQNTCVGNRTCHDATTASANTCVGQGACYEVTNGTNTAVGFHTLVNVDSASENVAYGYRVLEGTNGSGATATGGGNAAFGYLSLANFSTADNNACFGSYACEAVTTGDRNTVMGWNAADSLTSSVDSVIIGREAGQALTSENGNTIIGSNSGYLYTDVDATFLGWSVAPIATTATRNTLIGRLAAQNLTTGDRNILLGADAEVSSGTRADCIGIGVGVSCAADASIYLGTAAQTALVTSVSDALFGDNIALHSADATGIGMSIYTGANTSGDVAVVLGSSASGIDGMDMLNVASDVDGTPVVAFRVTQDSTYQHVEVPAGSTAVPSVAAMGDDDSGWGFSAGCPAAIDEGADYAVFCAIGIAFSADVSLSQNLNGFQTTGVGPGKLWRLPTHINAAPVKTTCDADIEGSIGYFDDSNDGLAGMPCTCIADDARTAFTWLNFYGGACPGA